MSAPPPPTTPPVSFKTRMFGYDREEVHAFIANVLEDYANAQRDLWRLLEKNEDAPARDVQRLLESAQRVANDLEQQAAQQRAKAIEEAEARAAEIVANAEQRAREIEAELVRVESRATALKAQATEEAQKQAAEILQRTERQASEITDEARRELERLDQRIALARSEWARLRSAFSAAVSTARDALNAVASAEPSQMAVDARKKHEPAHSAELSSTLDT